MEGHAVRANIPNVSPPKSLMIEPDNAASAERWKILKQMWENYVIISGINSQSDEYKAALFLHSIGADAMRVYNGFKFGEDEDKKNLKDIIAKFDQHFLGETKEFFERFKFNKRNQQPGETIDQYVSVLRNMAKTCGMCDCMREKLLMDRLLLGVTDEIMRERCISSADMDLSRAIDTCRASIQLKAMRNEEVHTVQKKTHKPKSQAGQSSDTKIFHKKQSSRKPQTKRWKFCNRFHAMRKEECPAWVKVCDACGWKNHFKGSLKCKKDCVHQVTYDDSADCESSATINTVTVGSVNAGNRAIYCKMRVNNRLVKLQIDCGATVCILPKCYVKGLHIRLEVLRLEMWNRSSIKPLGKCLVKVVNPANSRRYNVDFVGVDDDTLTPLLSRKAAEMMKLITVNYDKFEAVNSVDSPQNAFFQEFPTVFNSEEPGRFPGSTVHLYVDSSVEPSVRPS